MTENTYRVVGRKMQDYAVNVEAMDPDEAYDLAANMEAHKWSPIETDDVIEPIEVQLTDIQLNNDEWPEMSSGIIVGG